MTFNDTRSIGDLMWKHTHFSLGSSLHCLGPKELGLSLGYILIVRQQRWHSVSGSHSNWVCSLHLISFVLSSAAVFWGKKILFIPVRIETGDEKHHCETPPSLPSLYGSTTQPQQQLKCRIITLDCQESKASCDIHNLIFLNSFQFQHVLSNSNLKFNKPWKTFR